MSGLVPDSIIIASLLIDGDRSIAPHPNGGVAVRSGEIVAVGPSDELRARWPDVTVRAFPSGSLMPGFVDAHAHLTMPGDGTTYETAVHAPLETRLAWAAANAARHLSVGVTTIRDLGSAADFLPWAQAGHDGAPRIVAYGPPLTRPRGHLYLTGGRCSGPDEVAARVAANLAAGARGIKVVACGGDTIGTAPHIPSFDHGELVAAAVTAHKAGVKITAHATAAVAAHRVLDAGFDGIEHIGYLDSTGARRLDLRLVDRLAETQIAVGTTTAINLRFLDLVSTDPAILQHQAVEQARLDYVLTNCRTLHERGVKLIAGTDAGWNHTRFGDFGLEVKRMLEAGMTVLEVIEAATALPASLLGLPQVGRLVVGRLADAVVVKGNPISNPSALDEIQAVFLAGDQVHGRVEAR